MAEHIQIKMREAESKAWEALSGYKFWMFGYHAAQWVLLNSLLDTQNESPFRILVNTARKKVDEAAGQMAFPD